MNTVHPLIALADTMPLTGNPVAVLRAEYERVKCAIKAERSKTKWLGHGEQKAEELMEAMIAILLGEYILHKRMTGMSIFPIPPSKAAEGDVSFTDQKPFEVNEQPFEVNEHRLKQFTQRHKAFACSLCGKQFAVGDTARWVYANGADGPHCGNFFVCPDHDTPDVLDRAKESFETARRLAKQWDIYGPDWQRDL